MSFESHPDSETNRRSDEALSEMVDLTVNHRTLRHLFQEMAQTLQKVVSFDFINLSLHNAAFDTMRLHLWEGGATPAVPQKPGLIQPAAGSGRISDHCSSRI